jgi:hypothetical protein
LHAVDQIIFLYTTDINIAGKGVEQMSWNDITTLYKQGYQIGAQ